jgi:transposase
MGAMGSWLRHELNRIDLPVVCIDARHAYAALSARIYKSDRNEAAGLAPAASPSSSGLAGTVRFPPLRRNLDGLLPLCPLVARARSVSIRHFLENEVRSLVTGGRAPAGGVGGR